MKCPNCEKTLSIAERAGIEIDYCGECRGIWLDRGELDKIIERSRRESSLEGQDRGSRESYDRQHGYYGKPHKRKKSFLEELFD